MSVSRSPSPGTEWHWHRPLQCSLGAAVIPRGPITSLSERGLKEGVTETGVMANEVKTRDPTDTGAT